MNPPLRNPRMDGGELPAPVRRSGTGFLLWEKNFHPPVRDEDLRRFLRIPIRRELEGALAENANWAQAWFAIHGRPWLCAVAVRTHAEPGRGLRIDDEWFDSPVLAEKFAPFGAAVIAIVSAGAEADREAAARWRAGEPDRHYFLECHAAAVAGALLGEIHRRLRNGDAQSKAWMRLPHFGPGYSRWSIADTPRLLAHAVKAGELPGPLLALDSGMLRPKKSHLVLFGLEPADALHRS